MYRLTAFCPTGDSRAVVAALHGERGVSKVLLTRSSALDTEIDVVTAHVHRLSSDAVLQRLHQLRRWETRDITLTELAMIGAGEREFDDLSANDDYPPN